MRRTRNAKILATLGPASSDKKMIRQLFEAGADVFRLNFSHGTHEDHRERLSIIREVEREVGRPIGVLMDLQGPKLRVGKMRGGAVELKTGQTFRLDLDQAEGDESRAPLPHPEILGALHPGAELLLDDGKLRLQVTECSPDHAVTKVEVGGTLKNQKGVNVPGVALPISALTEKDRADLVYGLELDVDWVALSFVQRPEDILQVREIAGDRVAVMAKLEKPAALNHLDEIIKLVNGVMVARGDLGVEMPPEQVPAIQKRIVRACRHAGKPVVVATQMLESMITAPTPTRAEATDVATAVYDGADAVMLSAESAAGEFPIEAVSMMNRIIERTESDPYYRETVDALKPEPEANAAGAICAAMNRAAEVMPLVATITYTDSGSTSLRAARERPRTPILSLTPTVATARRTALVWGVHSVTAKECANDESIVEQACEIAEREGFAKAGDHVLITAGVPFPAPGTTNLLRIARLPG